MKKVKLLKKIKNFRYRLSLNLKYFIVKNLGSRVNKYKFIGKGCKAFQWRKITPKFSKAYDYLWFSDGDIGLEKFNWKPIKCDSKNTGWESELNSNINGFRAGQKDNICIIAVNLTFRSSNFQRKIFNAQSYKNRRKNF